MATDEKQTLELNNADGDLMNFDENGNSQEDGENSKKIWGRLLPLAEGFSTIEFVEDDDYTFGRGEEAIYSFNNAKLANLKHFAAFSKIHFTIRRENSEVFIIDNSSNGTFLNGDKIGKNNKRPLHNNDQISLPLKNKKAFVYMECGANDCNNFPIKLLEKYVISRTIGRGAMGEVRLAFRKDNCDRLAVKIISKNRFVPHAKNFVDTSKQIRREIEILKSVDHPCVIKIEDVLDTDDATYLVLELVESGELFDRIVNSTEGKLTESVAKVLFYQILLAIKYLHDLGITHRDLKPENILLASDNDETLIKITDFGLSKLIDGESMLKTFCGTPNYLAPEVLLSSGGGVYTKAVDLWSIGVILFVALSGYPPFSSDYTDMNIADQIKQGRYKFFPKSWKGVSETAVGLVKQLLEIDPNKRLTVDQALAHPWLLDEPMRKCAHLLMYPQSDGMVPPRSISKLSPQKRGRIETEEETVMETDGNDRKRFAP